MGPDPRQRQKGKSWHRANSPSNAFRTAPSSDDEHAIVYFRRHVLDDPDRSAPDRAFLNSCPPRVRAKMRAVLIAVAAAPPKSFSGGGYWEATHGEMAGWFEIRIDGPARHHYRLFCRLDYEAAGVDQPLLVVIDGRDKPFRTTLSETDYARIRSLGDEYFRYNPRLIL